MSPTGVLSAICSLSIRPFSTSSADHLCKVCGNRAGFIENGHRHPFCSRSCARVAYGKRSVRHTVYGSSPQLDLCETCGKRPRFVENGYTHPYCSRTCARAVQPQGHGRPTTSSNGNPMIYFYHKHDPYYGFTNFSPHPIAYNGELYPTSEHLFQSFKFEHDPNLVAHIRSFSQYPRDVFAEARRLQSDVRYDWNQVKIAKMELALYLKFTQHADLKAELLSTGNAELVEDSDKDSFWGIGADGRGRNELGKALGRLRSLLRGY
ncbi:hypothetical protein V5O48_007804 [Marasmius crinis-equi]|uniref:NADAR domain-containing protein n=1 Tax=Marasmius crinis-equi TaxID=585013 RepID=A0ABR3FFQ4_9AGAR